MGTGEKLDISATEYFSYGKTEAILWHNVPECTVLRHEECLILFYLELASILGIVPPCR